MHRFYQDINLEKNSSVTLTDASEVHHLKNVLRLTSGDPLQIFNGAMEAQCEIQSIDSQGVKIKIVKVVHQESLKPVIILACAIPKRGKFETIIEKTTELGVDEIIPLQTERTEIIIKPDRLPSKMARYEKVAINAAKQSRRATVPVIHPVTGFKDCIEELIQRSTVLMPSLSGEVKDLKSVLPGIDVDQNLSVLVGPEGDFTSSEYSHAHNAGCHPVSIGQTVLKVETAAIATVGFCRLFFNG